MTIGGASHGPERPQAADQYARVCGGGERADAGRTPVGAGHHTWVCQCRGTADCPHSADRAGGDRGSRRYGRCGCRHHTDRCRGWRRHVRIIGLSYDNTTQVVVANLDKTTSLEALVKAGGTVAVNSIGDFTYVMMLGDPGKAGPRCQTGELHRDGQLWRPGARLAGGPGGCGVHACGAGDGALVAGQLPACWCSPTGRTMRIGSARC